MRDHELIDILDDARMSYDNLQEALFIMQKLDLDSWYDIKDSIRLFKSRHYETMILLRALRDKLQNG